MRTLQLVSVVVGAVLFSGVLSGCEGDSDDDAATGGSSGSGTGGGSSGKGGTGTGGSGDAGAESGGTGATSGGSDGTGGTSGSGTGGSSAAGEAGDGAGGSTGGTTGGSGGSTGGTGGSSGSPALDEFCAAFVKLKKDKVAELGCSGDDSAAVGALCAVSGSCQTEIEAFYNCEKAATTWSCDTGDGHPQTNGACNTQSQTFFACLQTAIHEEDPFGCAAIAATNHEISTELGCNLDMQIEGTCNQLYLRDLCVEPWEDLTDCTDGASADDFECDEEDNLVPTICEDERAAFDGCLADLG